LFWGLFCGGAGKYNFFLSEPHFRQLVCISLPARLFFIPGRREVLGVAIFYAFMLKVFSQELRLLNHEAAAFFKECKNEDATQA
jgi:hypothetical protein